MARELVKLAGKSRAWITLPKSNTDAALQKAAVYRAISTNSLRHLFALEFPEKFRNSEEV